MEMPHKMIDNAGRHRIIFNCWRKSLFFQAGIMKEIEWENVEGILIPMENGVPANL